MSIEARHVSRQFGARTVLRDVSVTVPDGALVALLGPSGSGKTTLLRIIAGLDHPDSGQILLDGEDAVRRHARDRRVGYVFQHYALFRHMSVFENVAFGLRVRPRRERPAERVIRERVHDLLRLVQLEAFAQRYPHQLSGGQRQRIALVRALAVEPRVLLLDEPFGALDAVVRKDLRRWLRRMHDELHVTSVFVTHDQDEALEVADRVVVMNEGRVEQEGRPHEVLRQPATPFVREFLETDSVERITVRRGVTVWLTGLSGAGKSTIARALADRLVAEGAQSELLDGDVVRARLSPGLGFSREDRDAHVRRIAYVAELLTRNGVIAVAAVISPYASTRAAIRESIGDFVEVFVNTSLATCAARDPKGLYAKVASGAIQQFTGISDPYEAPESPDIEIRTEETSVSDAVEQILAHLRERGYLEHILAGQRVRTPDVVEAAWT